jgi:hypothetical protein
MNSEITEQYLNSVYENLQRYQMSLLADMKTGGNDLGKDKDIQKQLTLLNTLLINVLRFRNLKKQIIERNF